jgi:hypothetical protein
LVVKLIIPAQHVGAHTAYRATSSPPLKRRRIYLVSEGQQRVLCEILHTATPFALGCLRRWSLGHRHTVCEGISNWALCCASRARMVSRIFCLHNVCSSQASAVDMVTVTQPSRLLDTTSAFHKSHPCGRHMSPYKINHYTACCQNTVCFLILGAIFLNVW